MKVPIKDKALINVRQGDINCKMSQMQREEQEISGKERTALNEEESGELRAESEQKTELKAII